MKHAITFYIEDDADFVGFTGVVFSRRKSDDMLSSQCFNLNEKCNYMTNLHYYCPYFGNAYQVPRPDPEEVLKDIKEMEEQNANDD